MIKYLMGKDKDKDKKDKDKKGKKNKNSGIVSGSMTEGAVERPRSMSASPPRTSVINRAKIKRSEPSEEAPKWKNHQNLVIDRDKPNKSDSSEEGLKWKNDQNLVIDRDKPKISEPSEAELKRKVDQTQQAYYYITEAEATQKILGNITLTNYEKRILYTKLLRFYQLCDNFDVEKYKEKGWLASHPLHPEKIETAFVMKGNIRHCTYTDKEINETFDILQSYLSNSDYYGLIIESIGDAIAIIDDLLKRSSLTIAESENICEERKKARNSYIHASYSRLVLEIQAAKALSERQRIIHESIKDLQKIINEWKTDLEEKHKKIDITALNVEGVNFEGIDFSNIIITAEQLSTAVGLKDAKNLDPKLKEDAEIIKLKKQYSGHQRSRSGSSRVALLTRSPSKLRSQSRFSRDPTMAIPSSSFFPNEADPFIKLQSVIVVSLFAAVKAGNLNFLTKLIRPEITHTKNQLKSMQYKLDCLWLKKEMLQFEGRILAEFIDLIRKQYSSDTEHKTQFADDDQKNQNEGYLKKLRNDFYRLPSSLIDEDNMKDKFTSIAKTKKDIWFGTYNFKIPQHLEVVETLYKQKLEDTAGGQRFYWTQFIDKWCVSIDKDADRFLNLLKKAHARNQKEIDDLIIAENKIGRDQEDAQRVTKINNKKTTVRDLMQNVLTLPQPLQQYFREMQRENRLEKLLDQDVCVSPDIKNDTEGNSLLSFAFNQDPINTGIIKLLLDNNASIIKGDDYFESTIFYLHDDELFKLLCQHLWTKSLFEVTKPFHYVYLTNNNNLKKIFTVFVDFKNELDKICQVFISTHLKNPDSFIKKLNLARVYESFLKSAQKISPQWLLEELKELIEKFKPVDSSHGKQKGDNFNQAIYTLIGNTILSLEKLSFDEVKLALYEFNIYNANPYALMDNALTVNQTQLLSPRGSPRDLSRRSLRLTQSLDDNKGSGQNDHPNPMSPQL